MRFLLQDLYYRLETINVTISGSGSIPAGEYKDVSVSGSGRLYGLVKCDNFYTSGSACGESIECAECFEISGSTSFSGEISAEFVGVSGSLSCGSINCEGEVEISGSAKCAENIECDILSVYGLIEVDAVKAEKTKIRGVINCDGLLNSNIIDVKFDRGMNIGRILGCKISILKEKSKKLVEKLPVISRFFKKVYGNVCVEDSIEGDEIELENVICPCVTGRVVRIGAGCGIGLVQYEEEIEISPDAKVEKSEKI